MSKRLEYKFHREWLVDILKWAEGWQSKNRATDKPRRTSLWHVKAPFE